MAVRQTKYQIEIEQLQAKNKLLKQTIKKLKIKMEEQAIQYERRIAFRRVRF